MRIAFVSTMGGISWGGSEVLWHAAALEALSNGDQVLVSVYEWETVHPKIQQLIDKGAEVHFRKRYNAAAGMMNKLSSFIKSRNPSLDKDYTNIIRFAPDQILISQGGTYDIAVHHRNLYDLIKANNLSYSLICHSHEQYSFIPDQKIFPGAADIFRDAANVFFVSQRHLKLTERHLAMHLSNAMVTGNPLNLSLPVKDISFPENETVQFAIVGALSGSKGHDTAFEVLSSEQWKQRNWQLNIYGTGSGESYLKALAAFFDIEKNIIFHGHVSGAEEIWERNHLLLVPSSAEGLPISLVEAMMCKRCAVVTDVGGNTEMITDLKTGFTACAPSVSSFSAAMESAWSNKIQWKEMGERCFEEVAVVTDTAPQKKIYQLLRSKKS